MSTTIRIRLGTRSSPLALWQANWVAGRLRELGAEVELIHIRTQGDVKTGPLGEIGGQGLFTKEIQRALLDGQIDVAVHSLKDLPTLPVAGLQLTAVPPRESPGDVLVPHDPAVSSIASLPRGAKVGTGSTRRRAQLLHARPDLKVLDIRGNVDSRLRKLDEGEYDAIILAEAGLNRLGLQTRIKHVISRDVMLPAVGQGALGIETRTADAVVPVVERLNDRDTRQSVLAERAMLATLRGGCLAPVGAWGRVDQTRLRLDGVVLAPDGTRRLHAAADDLPDHAEALGARVAEQLLAQGAAELIAASRT